MRKTILDLSVFYSTNKEDFKKELNSLDIDQLRQFVMDLLDLNLTDPNFSSLAESIPLRLAGYDSHINKHGYDGFIGESYVEASEYVEHKPDKTDSILNKLDGGGGFADYTIKRWERDIEQGNKLKLMISGFVKGTLVYAYKIPHNHPSLMEHLKDRTIKLINKGKRVVPSFSYKHYEDCPNIELIYKVDNLNDFKDYMSKPFFNFVDNLK